MDVLYLNTYISDDLLFIGYKYGAGHSLQWQGEKANETNEVWRLFDTAGTYKFFNFCIYIYRTYIIYLIYILLNTCKIHTHKI